MALAEENFKIYVDRLREGTEVEITDKFDVDFLQIDDKELKFVGPLLLTGSAYVAETELIINWCFKVKALLPCTICTELTEVKVEIANGYECIQLSEIKNGIFNFKSLLREAVLIEVPFFAECNGGMCAQRAEISKYLKENDSDTSLDEGQNPFADFDWKD